MGLEIGIQNTKSALFGRSLPLDKGWERRVVTPIYFISCVIDSAMRAWRQLVGGESHDYQSHNLLYVIQKINQKNNQQTAIFETAYEPVQ